MKNNRDRTSAMKQALIVLLAFLVVDSAFDQWSQEPAKVRITLWDLE
jgi:hypothetical protein